MGLVAFVKICYVNILTNIMGLSSNQKKKLSEFRKWVKREKRRYRLSGYPPFSYGVDERTNKIVFRYSVNEISGFDRIKNLPILQKKKMNGYTQVDLNQYKYINVKSNYESVKKNVKKYEKLIHKDSKNFPYWIEEYTSNEIRFGNVISDISLKTDKDILEKYIKWITDNYPSYLDIYSHIDDGKSILEEYLIHLRNSPTKFGTPPTKNTLSNHYRRIKGFFNWISDKNHRFPYNMLKIKGWNQERDKNKLPPAITESDCKKLFAWIDENQNNKYEKHFIPILRMLLITGCRISEIISMKIKDIDIENRHYGFFSKGKSREIKLDSESLWNDLEPLILINGRKRTDKKYVFHLEYWRKTDKNGKGGGIKKDLSKHFSASGIQHKFKKVIKELGLNDRLSPHSCRRWFITYMLEKYDRNVPLVAQLVGHSSWEMVYRYNRERLPKQRTTIDINEIMGEI